MLREKRVCSTWALSPTLPLRPRRNQMGSVSFSASLLFAETTPLLSSSPRDLLSFCLEPWSRQGDILEGQVWLGGAKLGKMRGGEDPLQPGVPTLRLWFPPGPTSVLASRSSEAKGLQKRGAREHSLPPSSQKEGTWGNLEKERTQNSALSSLCFSS